MSEERREPEVHLYHATAPTCWWSWGYEAVLNRLRLVYGDRVKVHLLLGCVYEDLDEWMRNYEMTVEGQAEWAKEAAEVMGVPIRTAYGADQPRSVMPTTLAVLAAARQGEEKGERFTRAVLRRWCVEGQDVTREEVLHEAAHEAGLDPAAFLRDLRDPEARRRELEHQGHDFPHVPLGFYNLALTDGGDRTVILDYAFDPAVVDEAIGYLSGGRIAKGPPPEILPYLRRHGPAPLREIARVCGITDREAQAELDRLAHAGQIVASPLAGAPFWRLAPG